MADEFVAPKRTNEDPRKTIESVLLINESSLRESPNDDYAKSDELDREKTVSPSLEIAEECIQSFIHQGLETVDHEHQSSTNLLSNTYSRSGLEIHGTSTLENINKEDSFISNPVEQVKALGIRGMSESEEKDLKEETSKVILEAKSIINTGVLDASNVDDRLSINADDDVMDNSEKELYATEKELEARGGNYAQDIGDNLTVTITETGDKVGSKITCDFDKQDMEVTEKTEKENCDIDNNGKSHVDDGCVKENGKKRKKHKHHKKHLKKKKKKHKKEKKVEKEKGKDFKVEEEEESDDDDGKNLDDQVFETDSKIFSKSAEAAAASKESLEQKSPFKRKLLSVVGCVPSVNKTSLASKESNIGLDKDESSLVWHRDFNKVHYPRRRSSERSSNSSESIQDESKGGLARRRKSFSMSRMPEDRDQTGEDGTGFRSERTLDKERKRDIKKKRRRSREEESMELADSSLKRKKRDSGEKEKKLARHHSEGATETSRSDHPQKSRKSRSRLKESEDRRMSRSESGDGDQYPRDQERSRSRSSDRQRSGGRQKDRVRKHSQISHSKKSRSRSRDRPLRNFSDKSRSRSRDRRSRSRSRSEDQVSRDISDRSRSRSRDRPSKSKSKDQVSRGISDRSRSRSKDRPSKSKSKDQVSRGISDRSRSRSIDRQSPSRNKSKYQVSRHISDRSRSRSIDRPSKSKSKDQVSRGISDRSRSRSKDRPSKSKSKDQVSRGISDRSRSRSIDRRSSSRSKDQPSRSRSRSKDRLSKSKRKSQGQPSKDLERSRSGSVDQQSKEIKSRDRQRSTNKSEVKSIRDRSRSRSEERRPVVSKKSREKSQDEAPVRKKDKSKSRKEIKKRGSTSTESRSRSTSPSLPKPTKTKEKKKKKKKSKVDKKISLSGELVDKDQESHTIECVSKDKSPVNVQPNAPSRKRSLSRSTSRERSPKRHVQTSPKVLSDDTSVNTTSKDGSISVLTVTPSSAKIVEDKELIAVSEKQPLEIVEDKELTVVSEKQPLEIVEDKELTTVSEKQPLETVEDKELIAVSEKQSLDMSPARERSPEKSLDKTPDDSADLRLKNTTDEEHGKEELKEEMVGEFVAEEDTSKGDVEGSETKEETVETSNNIPKTHDVKETSGQISEEIGTARDEIDSSSKEKDSISSSLDTKHGEEVENAETKDQQNKETKEFKDETLEGNIDIVTPGKNSQQSGTILKNQNSIPTLSNQLGIPPPPLPPRLPYPLPTQSQFINSHLPRGAPHNMSNFVGLPMINPYSRNFQNPGMMMDHTPFHQSGVTVPQLPILQNISGPQNVPSSQNISTQNISSSSVQPGNQSNYNQLSNTAFTGNVVPQGFTLGPNQEPSKDGDSTSSRYMQQSSLLGLSTSASAIPFLDDEGPKIPPQTIGETSNSEVKAGAVEPKNTHASSPVDMDMSSPEEDIIERMNEEFWENELKESNNEEPYVPPEIIDDAKSDPTLQLFLDEEEDYDPEQFVTYKSTKKKKKEKKKFSDSQPKTKVQSLLDKLHRQARVEGEVKIVLKYYYKHREINKEEYKDILRKAVPQVANSDHSIDPERIRSLVKKYVAKMKGQRLLKPNS